MTADTPLLSRIQQDIRELAPFIDTIREDIEQHACDPPSVISLLAEYNYQTAGEILNHSSDPMVWIDNAKEQAMRDELNQYLAQYAPGMKDLNRYVTAISLYLTFFANRPLHPPGMQIGDIMVWMRGGEYYCTGKIRFMHEKLSLCRFCVCKPSRPE